MHDAGATRSPQEVLILGEKEALQRLELLASVSRILDEALEDYDQALEQVVDACVPAFADVCAIEVIRPDGEIEAAAYRFVRSSGLRLPEVWASIGRTCAPDRRPVLTFARGDEEPVPQAVRERFGAQSIVIAPIVGGGITLGWFVAATGNYRRGFRPSAMRIGVELASRLGATIQRVMLHREMQASARDQGRAVRRLRRLATAATNLAGAATTSEVLRVGCVEACVIQEADGAIAKWWMGDGTEVSAQAGEVNWEVAESAFKAVRNLRAARGRGWVAHPLPSSDPWQHAAMVVFVGDDLSLDEELVLSSLASLIPVAFERAVGTEAVVKHEARLRAVVDASPVALIGVRPDGVVTLANHEAIKLFDWDNESSNWALSEAIKPSVESLVEAVCRTGSIVNRTFSSGDLDLSLSGAVMPAVSPNDSETTVLVAGVDLSEVRRAERALVQAQRLEAMGVVAGRVAHDFNNILTLIVGYTELLGKGLTGTRETGLISDIESATKRAAALTKQMLGMTRRQEAGVVTDLAAELSAMNAVLSRMTGPKVGLTTDQPDQAVPVMIAPSEIEQIVINLVVNACDAMEYQGRIAVMVDVVAASPLDGKPEGALLQVADSGPGMSADVLGRCLEPFFTTKPKGVGSGLGMSTVYGVVSERGGTMEIESSPGQGTMVSVWLPLHTAVATGDAMGEQLDVWPAGRTIKGRVLLVEDDEELRPLGAECLTSVGCDVVAVPTAEDALKLLGGRKQFDVLVTDVMLPGISGIELGLTTKLSHPQLPVLYMTGYSGALEAAGMKDGALPLLRKPYRPDSLRLIVAELLGVRNVGAGQVGQEGQLQGSNR